MIDKPKSPDPVAVSGRLRNAQRQYAPSAARNTGPILEVRRGLLPARGIIPLHSPYSHDACDGDPRDEFTGAVDEDCLGDLREVDGLPVGLSLLGARGSDEVLMGFACKIADALRT